MPYKSKAQQRYFNAVLKKQDAAMVDEWNKETKGKYKSLPERVGETVAPNDEEKKKAN